MVYAGKYKYLIKTEEEEKIQKQLYASELIKLSKGTIDQFFGEIAMKGLISGQKWPDLADLVGMITGLRVSESDIKDSWLHFVNRKIGELWLDNITFECAKRIGVDGNSFIASRYNNNVEKAYKEYKEKYESILKEVQNGFLLTDITKLISEGAGKNIPKSQSDIDRNKAKAKLALDKLMGRA